MEATATATSSSGLTYLSSVVSQISLYPEPFAFSAQTSTIGPVQTRSLALVSVMASATGNVTEPLPTSIGVSNQLGSTLATYTQLGTTLSSNSQVSMLYVVNCRPVLKVAFGSFFNNRGAVVGTFVVVAIFSTAIFACLCVVWRHRLRRRIRDRMLRTITFPGDDGLQEGPHAQATMSTISDGTVSIMPTYRSDASFHAIGSGAMLTASISPPVKGATVNKTGPKHDGPFSNYFAIGRPLRGLPGLAVAANSRIDSPVPSTAPSTPSIYPPSLPPVEIVNNDTMVHPTPVLTLPINPPPRPPRQRPPRHSRDITEAAAMSPIQTASVSFATHVPPASSPYTPHPTSVTGAEHELSKLPEELHSLTPPLSISDRSQTDSQSCRVSSAARVLDHPTNGQLERTNTLFLKRTLVHVRDTTINPCV